MSINENKVVWGKETQRYPLIDELKLYLVARSIKRNLNNVRSSNIKVLDVGCGYEARLLHKLYPAIDEGVGVDFLVSDEIQNDRKLSCHSGDLYEVLPKLEDDSFDMIIFLSILEHLDNVEVALREARRLLKPGGKIFFNTPTWFGKWVLENIVSNSLLDPTGEIQQQYDTHKCYYNIQNFWPIAVSAGFISSKIKIWRSNFFCSISGLLSK